MAPMAAVQICQTRSVLTAARSKEQGEEETNANDLISKMELFGSDPKSLYMLNTELAARVYTAPSLVL